MATVKKQDQENFILSLCKLRVSYVSQRLILLTNNKSHLLPRQTHETVRMITWLPMKSFVAMQLEFPITFLPNGLEDSVNYVLCNATFAGPSRKKAHAKIVSAVVKILRDTGIESTENEGLIPRLLESKKRGDFMTLVPLRIGRKSKIFIDNRLLVHARAANGNIKPNIIKATLNSKKNKYAYYGYSLDACEFS